jgi:hypothetical protein
VLGDFHLLDLLSQGSTVTSNRYVSFRSPVSLSSHKQVDSARLSRAALGLSYLCPTEVFGRIDRINSASHARSAVVDTENIAAGSREVVASFNRRE